MTRTTKWNDKTETERYFTHNGHPDQAPNSFKKSGAGKGNIGVTGAELEDLISNGDIPPVFKKERRGSNHSLNEQKISKASETFSKLYEDDEEEEEDDRAN